MYTNYIFLTFFLFLTFQTSDSSVSKIACTEEKCNCVSSSGTVNCASKYLTEIPRLNRIKFDIKVLYMNRNRIQNMDLYDCDNSVYNTIGELHLQKNEIKIFDNRQLSKCFPHLQIIDIGSNLVQTLKYSLVSDMKHLKHLDLSFNKIFLIETGFFNRFPNLEILSLAGNKLLDLSPGIFLSLDNLKRLNLQSNLIRKLFGVWFSELKSLTNINLKENNISEWEPFDFVWPTTVRDIDLSFNRLPVVPPMPNGKDWMMDLNANNVSCNCQVDTSNGFGKGPNKGQLCGLPNACLNDISVVTQVNCIESHTFEKFLREKPLCKLPKAHGEVRISKDQTTYICHAYGFPVPMATIVGPDGRIVSSGKGATVQVHTHAMKQNVSLPKKCVAWNILGYNEFHFTTLNIKKVSNSGITPGELPTELFNDEVKNTKLSKPIMYTVIGCTIAMFVGSICFMFYVKCRHANTQLEQTARNNVLNVLYTNEEASPDELNGRIQYEEINLTSLNMQVRHVYQNDDRVDDHVYQNDDITEGNNTIY